MKSLNILIKFDKILKKKKLKKKKGKLKERFFTYKNWRKLNVKNNLC